MGDSVDSCDINLIKKADMMMLATEAANLSLNKNGDWQIMYHPDNDIIQPLEPQEAEKQFKEAFSLYN